MKELLRLIPPKVRKWLYASLSAALTIYGIWQATKGNVEQFLVSTATAAVTTLAAANVDTDEWGG